MALRCYVKCLPLTLKPILWTTEPGTSPLNSAITYDNLATTIAGIEF